MEHKKIKILFSSIFAVAFCVFVSAPIFAYDTYEIYPQAAWVDTGTSNWRVASDPDIPDSAFYSPVGSQTKEIGYLTGFPVPYYADGDHVSVFVDFTIGVPAEVLQKQQWVGLFIRPINSNTYLSNATNTGNGEWLIVNFINQTNLSQMYTGSFHWEDMSTYCSYKLLITYAGDGSASVTNSFIYHVTGVLDLNLTQSDKELRPFLLTAKYYLGYPANNVSNYGLAVSKDVHFRITDTSLYGELEALKASIDQLDFSSLADLGDLSTTIEQWYLSNTSIQSTIVSELENIIDDGETDPDITAAFERASEFYSEVEELQSIQDALIGTLEEYTFPAVSDANIANLIITPIFENEIVLFLVAGVLALLIACAIIL